MNNQCCSNQYYNTDTNDSTGNQYTHWITYSPTQPYWDPYVYPPTIPWQPCCPCCCCDTCNKCSTNLKSWWKYCPNCGKKITICNRCGKRG